jgi:O-antigen ligase
MLPALALAIRYRKRFLAAIFIVVMLLTLSRASIGALIVFAAIYMARGKHRRWVLGTLGIGGAALLAKTLMPNAGGIDQRLDLWRVALVMFQENPLTGAGLWSFERYYDQIGLVPELHGFHAHNLYLQIAAENGLAGLASLGIGGLWTLRSMHKRSTRLGVALLIALSVHGAMDYVYWYVPNLVIALIALWVCNQNSGGTMPVLKPE